MKLQTVILLVQYFVLATALLMSFFAAQDFRHYRAWRYVRNGVCSTAVIWSLTALLYFGA